MEYERAVKKAGYFISVELFTLLFCIVTPIICLWVTDDTYIEADRLLNNVGGSLMAVSIGAFLVTLAAYCIFLRRIPEEIERIRQTEQLERRISILESKSD